MGLDGYPRGNASPHTRGRIYSDTRKSVAVVEHIWSVLEEWFPAEVNPSVVMVWEDSQMPVDQASKNLKVPHVQSVELDGFVLVRREVLKRLGELLFLQW